MSNVTMNNEQQLYVIPSGKGFTCLGFDVCINKLTKLAAELDVPIDPPVRGSIDAYNALQRMQSLAHDKHTATGWKSKIDLIPEFIDREGERVEVVTSYGDKVRFYIGKSTGWIPCHLEIKQKNSTGGGSVTGYPFKSIKFLGNSRR